MNQNETNATQTPASQTRVRLGLIGTGIGRSLTPHMQEQMGADNNLALTYELFDTAANDTAAKTRETILNKLKELQAAGYTGTNVTHPFKEVAFALVNISDPFVKRIGAINTVRFQDWQGFNTDYSGFIRAYKRTCGTALPGVVTVVGAGGAGKAVTFALLALQATEIRITDTDFKKAEQLADALCQAGGNAHAYPHAQLAEICRADGLVNCTPVGMYQYPGNPIAPALVGGQRWVFDAIYTPLETEFMLDAKNKNLEVVRGLELMFYQAVDAFEIWTGHKTNEEKMYALLEKEIARRNSV